MNGRFFHTDGNRLFVIDFYHDDDLIGSSTITEQEAFEEYSKRHNPKDFWDLYA